MGFFSKLSKKCIFCGLKGNVKYVPDYGIYGDCVSGNWYHETCLREVCCDPEKFPSRTVDYAVDMIDRIQETKARKDKQTKRMKKQCEYLKSHCV